MIDRTSTPKAVSAGDIVYDEKQTGKYFKIIETFEKSSFQSKEEYS